MALRRATRTVSLAALVGATLVAPVTGYRALAHDRAGAKVTQLVVGWDVSDAKTMDPDRAYEFTDELADASVYDTLVTIHGGDVSHIRPDLATSWKVSGGGSVFTFKLRQGVKFASGNPLTAADVVFSYERLQNLKDNPSSEISGVTSIKALDPSTVQITLSGPNVSFLAQMVSPNFAVLDSKTVMAQGGTDAADAAKTDKATTYLDANSAGTGPYILKEWTRNTRVVLERNPNYWGSAPYFKEVILNGVKDAETQKLQLQKGDADMAFGLTSDQVKELKGQSGVRVDLGPTLDYWYLALNVGPAVSKPLSNPLVRQAIRYAIDYNGIINNLLNGEGQQLASIIPIGYVGNSPAQNAAQRIVTNQAKARALLAQAGYAKGFTVSLTWPAGYTYDGVDPDPLAAKLVNDLKAVGITATPQAQQTSVWLANYRAKKLQIGLGPWGADYPDAYDNLSYFGPGGNEGVRVNYTHDGNLAALIAKGNTIADAAKRGAIYNQVQQQLIKTGPWVALVQPDYPVGLRSDIKGYVYNPVWKVDFADLSK